MQASTANFDKFLLNYLNFRYGWTMGRFCKELLKIINPHKWTHERGENCTFKYLIIIARKVKIDTLADKFFNDPLNKTKKA